MKELTALTDPVYTPKEKYSSYEKFWLKYINDPRDLPFVHLLTAIHVLVIPIAILLYTPVWQAGTGGWRTFLISIFLKYILKAVLA